MLVDFAGACLQLTELLFTTLLGLGRGRVLVAALLGLLLLGRGSLLGLLLHRRRTLVDWLSGTWRRRPVTTLGRRGSTPLLVPRVTRVARVIHLLSRVTRVSLLLEVVALLMLLLLVLLRVGVLAMLLRVGGSRLLR